MGSKATFIEILSQVAGKIPDPTVETLNSVWKTIVGEEIGHRTRCIYVTKSEIAIETDERWLKHMRSISGQLLSKINHGTPWEFKKIKFSQGEFAPFIRPIKGAEPFFEDLPESKLKSFEGLNDLDEDLQLIAGRILQHIVNED